jgi:hypothetical protein
MQPARAAIFVALVGGSAHGLGSLVSAPPHASPRAAIPASALVASVDGATHRDVSAPAAVAAATTPAPAPSGARGLSVPEGGARCSSIGASWGCGAGDTCRIAGAGATSGRCEAAGPGGFGAACSASRDCDASLQCYAGACAYVCRLGSADCGDPRACTDVGNAKYGVCKPD